MRLGIHSHEWVDINHTLIKNDENHYTINLNYGDENIDVDITIKYSEDTPIAFVKFIASEPASEYIGSKLYAWLPDNNIIEKYGIIVYYAKDASIYKYAITCAPIAFANLGYPIIISANYELCLISPSIISDGVYKIIKEF